MKTGLTILRLGIAAIGTVLCLLIMTNSDSKHTFMEADAAVGGKIMAAIYLSVIVMVLAVALMVLFGLGHTFQNIGKSKGLIIGIVGFLVILAISYMGLASSEVLPAYGEGVTESTSKWVGAGIWATLLLGIIAIGAILYAEVSRIFK